MYVKVVTLWLQFGQPLNNVHETKWTPHIKLESDVAQSYASSARMLHYYSHRSVMNLINITLILLYESLGTDES